MFSTLLFIFFKQSFEKKIHNIKKLKKTSGNEMYHYKGSPKIRTQTGFTSWEKGLVPL